MLKTYMCIIEVFFCMEYMWKNMHLNKHDYNKNVDNNSGWWISWGSSRITSHMLCSDIWSIPISIPKGGYCRDNSISYRQRTSLRLGKWFPKLEGFMSCINAIWNLQIGQWRFNVSQYNWQVTYYAHLKALSYNVFIQTAKEPRSSSWNWTKTPPIIPILSPKTMKVFDNTIIPDRRRICPASFQFMMLSQSLVKSDLNFMKANRKWLYPSDSFWTVLLVQLYQYYK